MTDDSLWFKATFKKAPKKNGDEWYHDNKMDVTIMLVVCCHVIISSWNAGAIFLIYIPQL